MEETQKISTDEARLSLLWYLADCIWYFLGDADASEEEATDELEVCQGIALAVVEAAGLRVISAESENDMVLSVKLTDNAQEAVQKFLSGQ